MGVNIPYIHHMGMIGILMILQHTSGTSHRYKRLVTVREIIILVGNHGAIFESSKPSKPQRFFQPTHPNTSWVSFCFFWTYLIFWLGSQPNPTKPNFHLGFTSVSQVTSAPCLRRKNETSATFGKIFSDLTLTVLASQHVPPPPQTKRLQVAFVGS